jgi:glycogen operon protein
MLRRTRFLTGEYNEELGVKDVTWINANGSEMQPGDWQDGNMKCFGMLMDGRAQVTGVRKRGQDATLLMILNSFHSTRHRPKGFIARNKANYWGFTVEVHGFTG